MRIVVEPAIEAWDKAAAPAAPRDALAALVNARADRLGAATLDPARPIIASGHQAWLWHPGILAKDLAAAAAARRDGAQTLHLIVDQDQHAALTLDVPTRDGDRLGAATLQLAEENVGVPAGYQPPADASVVIHTLQQWGGAGSGALIAAWSDLPETHSLAEQVAVVVDRLRSPWAGPMPLVLASDLAKLPAFEALVDAMLADPRGCVDAYNRAVADHPHAGVAKLMAASRRVELPLWSVVWNAPRQKVYADLSKPDAPRLIFATGEAVDRERHTLLPTALSMTAVLRGAACDRFIHGTGGGAYDRVTEQWWQTWRGGTLCPMAVATADLYLKFDVPLAGRDELVRAVWHRHHLPHNLDRELNLTDEMSDEKRRLLEHMNDDRDHRRRRDAFEAIHRINAELMRRHPDAIARADAELARCRAGVANAAIARKRDWCFALYGDDQLAALAGAMDR